MARYWQWMDVCLGMCMNKLCQRRIGSAGMLIGHQVLKTLKWIEKMQTRLMVATFNCYPSTTIISCYSSVNVSDETDIITLYYELKHNVLIIGGDINAQIDKNVNNKFSLHNSSNKNGEHLTDFTAENRLTCIDSIFQKRKGKIWTNTYANNAKTPLDYILINKKWNNSELIWEAYSSFEGVSSDHRIVTAKMQSLRKNAVRTTTTVHFDLFLINNRDISNRYTLAQRNKFDALQEISETLTLNDQYRQCPHRSSSRMYTN